MSLNQSISQFFSDYQEAFEKLNLEQVRNYYALPCQMSMIGRVSALNNEKEFYTEFEPMFEALSQSGFYRAQYNQRSFAKLNKDQVLVSMGWKFYNHDNIEISEFAVIYDLKLIEDDWKIINVILHNIYKLVPLPDTF